jgi:hypothetical protein
MKTNRNRTGRRATLLAWLVGFSLAATSQTVADPADSYGAVADHHKLSATSGDMDGLIGPDDRFGTSVAGLGDLDGDGVPELAVGAINDDDGGPNHGAVWILHLAADGSVASHEKISDTAGGFTGSLDNQDLFGCAVAALGDLDGDGVDDLAVGAYGDDDSLPGPGGDRGAVWILFLAGDGSVRSHQKISDTSGGLEGALDASNRFGTSLAALGDIDADGVTDLAVGAPGDAALGIYTGAVWILRLHADGTVKGHSKITEGSGGFPGGLEAGDQFGAAVAARRDGGALLQLVVGAPGDDEGGHDRGAAWLLTLDAAGSVSAHQRISDADGGFTGKLDDNDRLGCSAADLGDVDGDGIRDLALGAHGDVEDFPTHGHRRGATWVLFLEADGSVRAHQKISAVQGGFSGALDDLDDFGCAVARLGDVDGDFVGDLVVGASGDDDGSARAGAAWVLLLEEAAPWTDHGNALAGTHGDPTLAGGGTLVPGEAFTLSLSDALELAPVYVLVGAEPLYAPLHNGGWVVPDPNPPGFVLATTTDLAGQLVLTGHWPLGLPAGFRVFVQAWLLDPGGPLNKAASNALAGTTQ